jgi:hypothetical protein
MAKRTPRSKANETGGADAPAQPAATPKGRRERVPAVAAAQPPQDASSAATRSDSMSSGPSEEAIRLRAYQRYLERGGGHGMEFEDWLHAEQELKARR